MKTENTFYVCHAVIVVAYMVLVGTVVFVSGNYSYLWLLAAIFVYQPWYKLTETKKPDVGEVNDSQINS
ncbi:hypothetical protein [Prevotella sp. E13-27]|uniref:hypothetical protein n=1 Tax=Prevotella sp. E13-27 TaxID=2938122 RepID=UPI00200B45CC|nr:hypothetical protein [Prevotella sp. E13-27]MCK8622611.1 hypothetical protein [Prevotella sp. E13-27]